MPFVQVDHAQLYYAAQGRQGMPIVLIHGAGGSHLIWGYQMRALQAVTRPIAIDLPGHGRSDPPGCQSVDAYAQAVLHLLDALGLERVLVAGHSLGGAIAQTLALDHPERVAGLGLIGTGARLRVHPTLRDGLLAPGGFDAAVQFILANSYAHLPPDLRTRAENELCACDPLVLHGDFDACHAFDVTARLGAIHAPTLVVCGRADRMTPVKYSEFLAAQIPHARLTVIDNAGHYVLLEQPEAVSAALVEFVVTPIDSAPPG